MAFQVFGHDPRGHLAPRLRSLGDRLQRTYCAAARGAVEVRAGRGFLCEGAPLFSLPEFLDWVLWEGHNVCEAFFGVKQEA